MFNWIGNKVSDAFDWALSGISAAFSWLFSGIGTIITGIFKVIGAIFGGVVEAVVNIGTSLLEALSALVDLIIRFVNDIPQLFEGFSDLVNSAFAFMPEEFTMLIIFGLLVLIIVAVIKRFFGKG